MNLKENLKIGVSPQIHGRDSTAKIMWTVILTLVPAGIWGVYVYGIRALFVLIVSILSAVITEYVINLFTKKNTITDGSAFLTGLLVGFNMPPSIPGFIPVIASVFAIAVVKWSFGGLGNNWANPALAGRAFVFFSWSKEMAMWKAPITNQGIDALSGASPLGFVKTTLLNYSGGAKSPMGILRDAYPRSGMDSGITAWINKNILSFFNLSLPEGYGDLFIGNISGCIGEVSALLLLAGVLILFIRKIVTWEIPVSYLASFGFLVLLFGGLRYNNGFFTGDVFFHLFTGGLFLGAFYMATDMVTSPLTRKGMIIFGVGAGILTFLIRFYGSLPEGVSLAILLMNICVAFINRYTPPKRFGIAKDKKEDGGKI